MPSSTVEAVVLRRWDSSESDRRVSILTREMGKLFAVARGARKANSKLAGVTEPLTRSKFELALGRTNYIIQAQPLSGYAGLRKDFHRLSVALAWLETLHAALHAGEEHPEAFELCVDTLGEMEVAKEPLGALCWGDLRLMEIIGHSPEFEVSVISGDAVPPSRALLCPRAGGVIHVAEAEPGVPVFDVSRETILALRKLQDSEAAPGFLRGAKAVVAALFAFWIEFLGQDLPGRRRLIEY
jgi:DNA repair protein RecO (recombination protein O)